MKGNPRGVGVGPEETWPTSGGAFRGHAMLRHSRQAASLPVTALARPDVKANALPRGRRGARGRRASAARRAPARNAARAPPPRSAPTSLVADAAQRAAGAGPAPSARPVQGHRPLARLQQVVAPEARERHARADVRRVLLREGVERRADLRDRRVRASTRGGRRGRRARRQRPRLAASRQRRAPERAHDAARERRLRRRARPAQLDEAVPEPGQVPSRDRGHALEAPATVRRGDGRVHDKLRQVGARPRVRRGGRVDVAEAAAAERLVGAVPAVRVERPRVPALAPRRGVPPRRLDDPSGLRGPRDRSRPPAARHRARRASAAADAGASAARAGRRRRRRPDAGPAGDS